MQIVTVNGHTNVLYIKTSRHTASKTQKQTNPHTHSLSLSPVTHFSLWPQVSDSFNLSDSELSSIIHLCSFISVRQEL